MADPAGICAALASTRVSNLDVEYRFVDASEVAVQIRHSLRNEGSEPLRFLALPPLPLSAGEDAAVTVDGGSQRPLLPHLRVASALASHYSQFLGAPDARRLEEVMAATEADWERTEAFLASQLDGLRRAARAANRTMPATERDALRRLLRMGHRRRRIPIVSLAEPLGASQGCLATVEIRREAGPFGAGGRGDPRPDDAASEGRRRWHARRQRWRAAWTGRYRLERGLQVGGEHRTRITVVPPPGTRVCRDDCRPPESWGDVGPVSGFANNEWAIDLDGPAKKVIFGASRKAGQESRAAGAGAPASAGGHRRRAIPDKACVAFRVPLYLHLVIAFAFLSFAFPMMPDLVRRPAPPELDLDLLLGSLGLQASIFLSVLFAHLQDRVPFEYAGRHALVLAALTMLALLVTSVAQGPVRWALVAFLAISALFAAKELALAFGDLAGAAKVAWRSWRARSSP